ncbi:hypothetical protein [Streptomyces sp. P17]|uniref:hypothetical protein n=1 Tax=Streptomyces sp. P17 TaxID=3074716 RepID=UPI0028F44D7D|nr:hypothetical protein [Streptomyces sp. P17]MDT9700114.1 hypothetical protein [Streptomyces sp. P17]
MTSGSSTPMGSRDGSTRSTRRRSPTRVTRLSAVRLPVTERLDPGEHLPHSLVQRPALTLRAEEEGVAETATAY